MVGRGREDEDKVFLESNERGRRDVPSIVVDRKLDGSRAWGKRRLGAAKSLSFELLFLDDVNCH